MTSPAISHQIKALEEYLGFALFERMRRGVRLTEKGETYFQRISRAFETVSDATKEVRQASVTHALHLAIPPHLLSAWMIPRLPRFLKHRPLTKLRLVDTVRRIDFESEGIDAQILWGTGTWSGLDMELLIEDQLCVVCSPKFIDEFGPFRSIEDLATCPLIHTERRPLTWERALNAAGIERTTRARSLYVLRPMPAVQAAIRGMGAAIVSRICVADNLASGTLVMPFEHEFNSSPKLAYFLAYAPKSTARTTVEDLRDWLRAELTDTLGRRIT